MKRLEGKVAFVTGAGGGIGQVICQQFIAEGAAVMGVDINEGLAQQAVAGATAKQAASLRCDVTDPDSVSGAIKRTVETFGKLNILCNVAGGSSTRNSNVAEIPDEVFWQTIKLDLYGTFLSCKYGIPHLVAAGGGAVVNFTSINAVLPGANKVAYIAAKGGIVSMTKSLAVDYGRQGIRANCIAPGRTLTPRTRPRHEATGGLSDKLGQRHLLGLIETSDIANLALFLASDESRKITGQMILADSGASIA